MNTLKLIIILIFILSGCGLVGENQNTVNQGPIQAQGNVSFERVPIDSNGALDYSNIEEMPLKGIKIQLILVDGDTIISNTKTDDLGNYTLRGEGSGQAYIRIYAQLFDYPILVQNNTAQNEIYVAESSAFPLEDGGITKNMVLPCGWDESGNNVSTRSSAPFAILDSIYSGIKLFTNYDPTIIFPQLKVNWSEDNTSTSGTYESGNIGTSHWNHQTKQLYILGRKDVDTDEFDHHVIVHEWGHYFEDQLSRADSFGGAHSEGSILDPRVAFSEGLCNAISAMALYPDTVYRDSGGVGQQDGLVIMDIEDGVYSNNPGWFSETSVHQIVYDLWDGVNDDTISLGIGPIYNSLTSSVRNTTSFTTIFPFIAGLLDEVNQSDLDSLLAKYSIDPIFDSYGTNETNYANWSYNLPVYNELLKGATAISMRVQGSSNVLASNRLVKFTPTSSSITLQINSSQAVSVELYYKGEMIDIDAGINGVNTISFSTDHPNKEHILGIYGNTNTITLIELEYP